MLYETLLAQGHYRYHTGRADLQAEITMISSTTHL